MTERAVRSPDAAWEQTEALPFALRDAVERVAFHLMDEPVPSLAEPYPEDDLLPGAYRIHLPSDGVTIWYTVTPHEGREIITIQYVRAD